MQEPIVEIRDLTKVCGHSGIEVEALDRVNLDSLTTELTAKVDFLAD